jgi:hypothetical protein
LKERSETKKRYFPSVLKAGSDEENQPSVTGMVFLFYRP